MMSSEIDEIKRIGHKNCWIKKMRFQHWWFINRGYAKLFINLGGPTFFKLPKKLGQWWLINLEGLINPNLALHGKKQ